jgi:hypothetical protein
MYEFVQIAGVDLVAFETLMGVAEQVTE